MKNLKKFLCLILSLTLCLCFTGCGSSEEKGDTGLTDIENCDDPEASQTSVSIGNKTAVITVKDFGVIEVELYSSIAPVTVSNFVKLANEGFYDGLTFHRIIKDFMIQGGDPEGTGLGGSEETIMGEFSSNGFKNSLSHVRGVISMARLGSDPNSASSQFFIVHKDSPHLDGDYAAFGKVTKGIEVVDKLAEETPVTDSYSGTVEKQNQPVIESIKIID